MEANVRGRKSRPAFLLAPAGFGLPGRRCDSAIGFLVRLTGIRDCSTSSSARSIAERSGRGVIGAEITVEHTEDKAGMNVIAVTSAKPPDGDRYVDSCRW